MLKNQNAKTPLRKQNLITVNIIDKNKSKTIFGAARLFDTNNPKLDYVELHFLPVYLDIQGKDQLQIGSNLK